MSSSTAVRLGRYCSTSYNTQPNPRSPPSRELPIVAGPDGISSFFAEDKGCRHLSRRYGSECRHKIWILMGKICLFSFNVSVKAFHQKPPQHHSVFISKRCEASAALPVVLLKRSVGYGKQTAQDGEPSDGLTTTDYRYKNICIPSFSSYNKGTDCTVIDPPGEISFHNNNSVHVRER